MSIEQIEDCLLRGDNPDVSAIGFMPENKVILWVFKAEKSDDWFVELENKDKGVILRSFKDNSPEAIHQDMNRRNATWFGNLVGEILGIPCVECGTRGL